jgi:hypothetical protein
MKLEFSRQIFEKYSNVKFYENPSSGSQVVPCGRADGPTARRRDGETDRQTDGRTDGRRDTARQTDRHDEAYSWFSQSCEPAKNYRPSLKVLKHLQNSYPVFIKVFTSDCTV